jgi:7-carboxy-7-deazaguanine synthase
MGVASVDTRKVERMREQIEQPAKRYAVKAVWRTLQGEGAWAGRPAVFVRFVGCNMWTGYERDRERDAERTGADCPRWCDTDFTKENALHFTADALADKIRRIGEGIRFCVLTGGEPFLQADAALVRALHAAGFEIAVETNGTVALAEAFEDAAGTLAPPDWIVCSPKLPEDRLTLEWCDELKLVVPDYRPAAYARFAERVRPHVVGGRERRHLWLQPEDGPRLEEATHLAIETALAYPAWRVSVQTHKILGID